MAENYPIEGCTCANDNFEAGPCPVHQMRHVGESDAISKDPVMNNQIQSGAPQQRNGGKVQGGSYIIQPVPQNRIPSESGYRAPEASPGTTGSSAHGYSDAGHYRDGRSSDGNVHSGANQLYYQGATVANQLYYQDATPQNQFYSRENRSSGRRIATPTNRQYTTSGHATGFTNSAQPSRQTPAPETRPIRDTRCLGTFKQPYYSGYDRPSDIRMGPDFEIPEYEESSDTEPISEIPPWEKEFPLHADGTPAYALVIEKPAPKRRRRPIWE